MVQVLGLDAWLEADVTSHTTRTNHKLRQGPEKLPEAQPTTITTAITNYDSNRTRLMFTFYGRNFWIKTQPKSLFEATAAAAHVAVATS